MSSRAQAYIRLSALRHNLQRVREQAPGCKVMAAIKADAYGHGALRVAEALADADALAVATLEEAMQLRWHGEQRPIVLLAGVHSLADMRTAAEQSLQLVVHDPVQLRLLSELEPLWSLGVWLKLDTGMHRLGFTAGQAVELLAAVTARQGLRFMGWMTHLACADDLNHPATSTQIEVFDQALAGLQGERSIANSAGILAWPASHRDWVRPGIMLYGASPMLGGRAVEHDLQPAMSLRSELIAVHRLKAGDAVGYGQSWTCPEDMDVGVVGAGYGDGYPRHAPSGTPLLVAGQRVSLIGRVSMDMICVDLRACPKAQVGDGVELWGDDISVEEVAEAAGTISYELYCRLTGRVEMIYSD